MKVFSLDDQDVDCEHNEIGYHNPGRTHINTHTPYSVIDRCCGAGGALSTAFTACIVDAMGDVAPPSYRVLLSSLRRTMRSHGFSAKAGDHIHLFNIRHLLLDV